MGNRSTAEARREARLPAGAKGVWAALLSWPLATGFRLLPYKWRLTSAVYLSIPLTFVARGLGRQASISGLGVRELVLGRLLSLLHYRHVTYPAGVSIVSDTPVRGPLLLAVRHSLVNQLFIRRLVEDGHPVTLVMSHLAGSVRTFGGNHVLDVLEPSAMLLRGVAGRLEDGRIVVTAIDAPVPLPGYSRVETNAGPWYLADQPLRLALKLGVPVGTVSHDIERGRIVSHVRMLATGPVDALRSEYCAAYGVRTVG